MLDRVKKILQSATTESTAAIRNQTALTKQIMIAVAFGCSVGLLANLNQDNPRTAISNPIFPGFSDTAANAEEYNFQFIKSLSFRDQNSLNTKSLPFQIKELARLNTEYFTNFMKFNADPTFNIQKYELLSFIAKARIDVLNKIEPATDAKTSGFIKKTIAGLQLNSAVLEGLYEKYNAEQDKFSSSRGEYLAGPAFSKN